MPKPEIRQLQGVERHLEQIELYLGRCGQHVLQAHEETDDLVTKVGLENILRLIGEMQLALAPVRDSLGKH